MELRRLRHATTLAAEGSFSRAAEKLNLSQSALSKSIAVLEREFGLSLFDRNSSGISLTTAGQEFVDSANRLLQQARTLSVDMSLLRDGYTGTVAFGMGSFPAAAYQQAVITELMNAHPGLCVRVEVSTPEHLLEHLAAEQIEFFFGDSRGIALDREYVADTVVRLRTSFMVRSGHPLLSAGTLKANDLLPYPVIGAPILHEKLDSTERWLGISPAKDFRLQVVSENIAALEGVTSATNAIFIVPYSAVAAACQAGILTELQLPRRLERSYINVDLVRPVNRKQSAAAKVVVDVVKRLARQLRQQHERTP